MERMDVGGGLGGGGVGEKKLQMEEYLVVGDDGELDGDMVVVTG